MSRRKSGSRGVGFVWLAALSWALLGGCSNPPPTQIVVRIESDIAPRTEVTEVRVRVQAQGSPSPAVDRTFRLSDGNFVIPGEIGLIAEDPADTRRVVVELTASVAGGVTFFQRANVAWTAEQTMSLGMLLARRCQAVVCASGMTCTDVGCVSESRTLATHPSGSSVVPSWGNYSVR